MASDSDTTPTALMPYGMQVDPEPRLELKSEGGDLPPPENLELAESVLQRLNPKDRHELGQMVHSRAVASGVLISAIALFWWLTIVVVGPALGDNDSKIPESLFGFDFILVSALVPILVFVATVLLMLSRERIQTWSGLIAGGFYLFALFLTAEPLGWLAFTDQGDPAMILQTIRLLVLGVMVFYCAHLFLDALLLSWVRRMLLTFPLDLQPLEPALQPPTSDGHPDEG